MHENALLFRQIKLWTFFSLEGQYLLVEYRMAVRMILSLLFELSYYTLDLSQVYIPQIPVIKEAVYGRLCSFSFPLKGGWVMQFFTLKEVGHIIFPFTLTDRINLQGCTKSSKQVTSEEIYMCKRLPYTHLV